MSASSPDDRIGSLRGTAFGVVGAACAELAFGPLAGGDAAAACSRAVVVFVALYVVQRTGLSDLPAAKRRWRDVMTLTLVLGASFLVEWMCRILGLGLLEYARKAGYLKEASDFSVFFAMPYASGGMLTQVILGRPFALVFAFSFAAAMSAYFSSQPFLFLLVLTANLVASLSLRSVRTRSAYFRAGSRTFLVTLVFALASVAVFGSAGVTDVTLRLAACFFGAVLGVLIAAGFTPVVEYLGGYVTDIRLIEMATLDHPLLKELSVQAPGTWNHSMVMGMMTESAADSVGANSVLARVSCYFHDVGKARKPLYFVENQVGGENRHDKLSPSMSALIIKSHVKDGLELARKAGLPEIIQDMITQHHGSSVIEYFYEKALKEAEAQGLSVDRSHYTYPGPKPQTKEAGILMLADGIEAASRTLVEPTADRIQGMVQKMINKVFASGELAECDLSLSDLHQIAKCFTRVLTGIHHQRVAYSEPVEKGASKETSVKSAVQKQPDAQAGADTPREPKKEDLKRLGI